MSATTNNDLLENRAEHRAGNFEELETVTIRFAGDSGDGMQITGTQFTSTSAIIGNDISTLPDFPAEIRAPAGSLPGVERHGWSPAGCVIAGCSRGPVPIEWLDNVEIVGEQDLAGLRIDDHGRRGGIIAAPFPDDLAPGFRGRGPSEGRDQNTDNSDRQTPATNAKRHVPSPCTKSRPLPRAGAASPARDCVPAGTR